MDWCRRVCVLRMAGVDGWIIQEHTRELENAFERTSQPLSSAVDCLDKHHLRNDYDLLRLDEVEDTLTEVLYTASSWHSTADTDTDSPNTAIQSYVRRMLFPCEEVGEDVRRVGVGVGVVEFH